MADLRKLLGANVRRLREERGLTQAQLAEAAGRSVDMISRLERGDAAPSLDTLSVLSENLHADPAELFGGLSMGSSSAVNAGLLKQISGLNSAEQEWLSRLVDHLSRRPSGS